MAVVMQIVGGLNGYVVVDKLTGSEVSEYVQYCQTVFAFSGEVGCVVLVADNLHVMVDAVDTSTSSVHRFTAGIVNLLARTSFQAGQVNLIFLPVEDLLTLRP